MVVAPAFPEPAGTVVVLEGTVVVEVEPPEAFVGSVVGVVVVVAVSDPPLPLPSTTIGVVDPGCGCQPGGAWV